jgi:hypothetical protein
MCVTEFRLQDALRVGICGGERCMEGQEISATVSQVELVSLKMAARAEENYEILQAG